MRFRLPPQPVRVQLLATALVVALPAAAIVVYSGLQFRNQALEDATQEARRLADAIAAQQESLVAGAEQLMSALAQLPEVRSGRSDRVHALLADVLKLNARYSNIFVADPGGRVWAQGLGGPPFGVADRRYFQQALSSGRLSSGEYVISRATGRAAFNFALPYRDGDGAVAGVICVGFDLTRYRRFVTDPSLPAGTSYLLLDHRGVVLARASDEERFVGRPIPPATFQRIVAGPDRATWNGVSMAGDERLAAIRKLRLEGEATPHLYVLAGIPVGPIHAQANRLLLRNGALFLLFLSAAASLAWLLGERSIAEPLRRLEAATRRIAGGDLEVRVSGAVGGREIGALARTFDEMARQLAEREEARRLGEQLLFRSQRMESVGRLAGGIAHDFNNLLTVINGHCELLRQAAGGQPELLEDVEVIRMAGESAATLTRQLLAFSRRQLLQPRVLDLNALVADTERMLRRLIGEDVQLVTRLAPGLWPVRADPGQVEQVIMNLAVNARDAMPRGGTLTLETANLFLDGPSAAAHKPLRPGDHVLLSVSDSGVGMDPGTLEHVFEPFFTTKQEGKGTGLGLSTVYGIVAQSGGQVAVESQPGRGTTFRILLPRETSAAALASADRRPAPADVGGQTILVVEDSDGVRELVRDVLRRRGCTVLAAAGGEEALALAERHDGPIHLLLADVVMPGMGGREVAERLAARRPGLRVLFMSGYTEDAVLTRELFEARLDLLEKPFTPEGLVRKVGEVLGRGAGLAGRPAAPGAA